MPPRSADPSDSAVGARSSAFQSAVADGLCTAHDPCLDLTVNVDAPSGQSACITAV
jgi:hypothetical protein